MGRWNKEMIIATGMHADRFEVLRMLGEGGLARVFLVRHRKLRSLHALKVLHATSPKALKRFLQEGQVQAQIRHPNVVAVTDVVELEGQIGLVMEYVEGSTLADVINGRPLPSDDLVALFQEMCEGVMAAHRQGVLHRDLKPGNVLLAVGERGVHAKITDFGIAKVLREVEAGGPALTEAGTTIGTPGYMAPEQLMDASTCDQRADVFALGCILYEMVVGSSPYLRPDRIATSNATLSGEHIPAAQIVRGLSAQLDAVIERAIHPDPNRRPATVSELLGEALPALRTMPKAAPETIVADTGTPTLVTPETRASPAARAWTQDLPDAGSTAGRARRSPVPTPRTVQGGRGPILDFRRRRRWGAIDVLAPVLLTGLCGAAFAWSVHDAAGEQRDDVRGVRELAVQTAAPWSSPDGPTAEAWALAADRDAVLAEAETFRTTTTPEARLAAAHGLVRTLRADVTRQAQTQRSAEARTALARTLHELDLVDTQLASADARLATVAAQEEGTIARVARALGWLGEEDLVGAPVLDPLPELAALSAPPRAAVASRPSRGGR